MNSNYEELEELVTIKEPIADEIAKLPAQWLHRQNNVVLGKSNVLKEEVALKQIRAKKAQEYRADASIKSTEASIAEKVENDPAVQSQTEKLRDAEEYLEQAKMAILALEMKKSSLSFLVALLTKGA